MNKTYIALFFSLFLLVAYQGFAGVIIGNGRAQGLVTVTITNGIYHETDTMGFGPRATYCLDASLGESELPPSPVEGILDIRFIEPECTPIFQGLSLDIHPLTDTGAVFPFEMTVQKSSANAYAPIFLSLQHGWQSIFPGGLGIVDATTGGTLFDVDMFAQNRDTVTLQYSTISNGVTTIHDLTDFKFHYYRVLGVASSKNSLPAQFALWQNFPNPFNPTTVIRYDLPKASFVRLALYNILGQEIRTLVNKNEPPGEKSVTLNATALPSGVYFYRIQAGEFNDVKKMVLMK